MGRGILSVESATVLGKDFPPDCRHMWRSMGPIRDLVATYVDELPDAYNNENLRELATRGDHLIRSRGGVYPALVGFRENQMRSHVGQLDFATEHRKMFPAQYQAVMNILDQGVRAVYNNGLAKTPRVRGLPYNRSASEMIAEKFLEDIRARRFFVCSTERITLDSPSWRHLRPPWKKEP